jgi:hypothetical protein
LIKKKYQQATAKLEEYTKAYPDYKPEKKKSQPVEQKSTKKIDDNKAKKSNSNI